ncbi:MAG: hypothetical protein JWR15_1440, partial [Prosthecobacter sp.]|nr:hypothetical protein [Prosthecobacter sp.]
MKNHMAFLLLPNQAGRGFFP